MVKIFRQPGKTGMENLRTRGLEDPRHARLSLDPLILRRCKAYKPRLKLRRFSHVLEGGMAEKSWDPTSRWRVKQAAYLRSENRAQVKGEEILLKIYSRARSMILQPRMILDTLILRQYHAYTPRGKLLSI